MDRRLEVLEMVKKDVKDAIAESEGMPFTGRLVHTLFGKQAAAINALAEILESIIKEDKE